MNNVLKSLILLFIFLYTGCGTNSPVEDNFVKYRGTWLWIEASGGIMGRVFYPDNGEILKLEFDNFNIFRMIQNDSLKVLANYSIEKNDGIYDKITYSNIVNYNFPLYQTTAYAFVSSDTLVIWDGAYDGYMYSFKKVH